MVAAILVPAGALAMGERSSQSMSVSVGNTVITLSRHSATVSFAGQSYNVNWEVAVLSSNGPEIITLSNVGYSRISDPAQNSLVLKESNAILKIAEIFSFHENAVDSSIAVKNLQNVDLNVEAIFSLKAPLTGSVQLNGFSSGSISNISGNSPAVVGSQYQSMILGQADVNWQSEAAIFGAGIVAQSISNTMAALPFGPIRLAANENYSIDPLISPEVELAASPSMMPIKPMSCIGGTCGGGGGGSAPGGSTIVSVTPNVITKGTTVSIVAHADSVGSGGATLHLNVYNETSGAWTYLESTYIGSSTGDVTFQWADGQGGTSLYNWSEVAVYASNSYGSGGWATEPMYSQTLFSVGGKDVFSSSGTVIGAIVNSIDGPVAPQPEGDTWYLAPTTTFIPSSSQYEVHYVNQSIKVTGESNSENPGFNIVSLDQYYFQNSTNENASSIYGIAEDVGIAFSLLLTVAAPEAGAIAEESLSAAIGFLALLQTGTSSSQQTSWPNGWAYYSSGATSVYNGYMCDRFGLDCYNQYWPLYIPGTNTPSYIYALHLTASFYNPTGGCLDVPYAASFGYSTSFTITDSGSNYASTYGGSLSIPFMVTDYVNAQC